MASIAALQRQLRLAIPEDSCKLVVQACANDDFSFLRVASCNPPFFFVYHYFFNILGLCALLEHLKVAPSQLHPNNWVMISWVSLNNMSKKLFEFYSNVFHYFKDRFFEVLATDLVVDGLPLMFNQMRSFASHSIGSLTPTGSRGQPAVEVGTATSVAEEISISHATEVSAPVASVSAVEAPLSTIVAPLLSVGVATISTPVMSLPPSSASSVPPLIVLVSALPSTCLFTQVFLWITSSLLVMLIFYGRVERPKVASDIVSFIEAVKSNHKLSSKVVADLEAQLKELESRLQESELQASKEREASKELEEELLIYKKEVME
ncbi:hypothetical protein HKD37_06G016823 [Glycine soja]